MIAGNPRIRPVANSQDHTLCLELKWDRYQQKKSFHDNVSSRRDQGCSHSRSGDLPPSWKIWNTNMATQISREICDVMWKRSIRTGSISAKVVSVDCIHVIGLSIRREHLLPLQRKTSIFPQYFVFLFNFFSEIRDFSSTITLAQKFKFEENCLSEGIR